MKKRMWVGKTGALAYEVSDKKYPWSKLHGFQGGGRMDVISRGAVKLFYHLKLKPGAEPIEIMVDIRKVPKKRKRSKYEGNIFPLPIN